MGVVLATNGQYFEIPIMLFSILSGTLTVDSGSREMRHEQIAAHSLKLLAISVDYLYKTFLPLTM